ncbi:TPA: hypothetical protein OG138_003926 [Klebsiella quasipneumoniae]|nr:hypothetical protein [Klebsiella quasipneumoniae]
MPDIEENKKWGDTIPLIMRGDKVLGGRQGLVNIQASVLASRTLYLKNQLEAYNGLLKSGELPFTDSAAATEAINSGKVPQGAKFSVRSDNPDVWAEEFINQNGQPVSTGKILPSLSALTSLLSMLNSDGLDVDTFYEWTDKNGLVFAEWVKSDDGIAFISSLLEFGPEGFKSKYTELSLKRLLTGFFDFYKNEDGSGISVEDKHGLVSAELKGNTLEVPAVVVKSPGVTLDVDLFSIIPGGKFGSDGLTFLLKDGLEVEDKHGLVSLDIKPDGDFEYPGKGKTSNSEQVAGALTEKQVINLLDGTATAYASKRHNQVRFPVPRANRLKKLTYWFLVGQSFVNGGGSSFAIPDTTDMGNIMLGQSPRGSSFVKGLASYEFGPVGGNVFYPLKEVRQTDAGVISETSGSHGETIAKAFADELKRRYNERTRQQNNTDHIFGVSCCGVSGASIADLTKGAPAGYYNRFLTALSGVAAAAAAAGYEWEVGGLIYTQGEHEAGNGTTTEIYQPQLQAMYDNMIADAMAASGQKSTPIFLINQVGNSFISGRNFGVVEAQRRFVEENPLAFMVGSYAGLPNPVDHLFANSYRWLGAQFAKVADRVMWGNDEANFQMVGAYFKADTVYAGLSTRVPPLTFKSAYVTYTETMYHDKGFTVSDGSGVLTGEDLTVSIVSDNVIKIVASRPLTGTVTIMLGDGTAHAGVHNIADSDTEISEYVWESGLQNQPATENIASLNNKHYSLANRALIQKITAQEF